MNQFGDERKLSLSDYYPEKTGALLSRIARDVRPVILGVTYWNCGRPWSVPVRRICDNFFLFVEHGAEAVSVYGETKILHRGDGIVVPEFAPHSFGLSDDCPESSHFIAHTLAENVAGVNPFAGFSTPFLRLKHPDAALDDLKRTVALRSSSPDAAADRMVSWIRTLMMDEAEAGRFQLEAGSACDDRISAALDFIRKNFSSNIGVRDLARAARLGEVRFRTLFAEIVGMSPAAYLLRYRLIHAARLLARYEQNVAEVADCCGFSTSAYFCTVFKHAFGRSPGDYRTYIRR